MTFKEAFEAMKHGAKVKLPSWAGYWFWGIPAQSILMHTKDGKDIDVRSTECVDYTFTNISMIKEKGLKREGEKILGLDDYMTELRESQKDAFAQTDAPAAPTFTVPTTKGGESSKTPVYTPPTVW